MSWKQIAILSLLGLAVIFLAVKIYSFVRQEQDLSAQLSDMTTRLTKAQATGANLQGDLNYLANPANLEKELRTRFNYKKPGENMIIIVPSQTSTGSSTQ